MEVDQGPDHTEKSYRQLLPKEARAKTDWSVMWQDKGYEEPDSFTIRLLIRIQEVQCGL